MTYTEQIKSILEKSGVDTSALPDNLYSTLLNALLNAEMGGGGLTREEVEKIVTDEVAKIVADAPEDFDTLKEMSNWISQHEDSAAAMNSSIQQNATDISTLKNDSHTHTNKTVLDGITQVQLDKITTNETNISNVNTQIADIYNRCGGGKNLFDFRNCFTASPNTIKGIKFVANGDGTFTVSGESNSNDAYFDIYQSSTVIPPQFKNGKTYKMVINNSKNKIALQVLFFTTYWEVKNSTYTNNTFTVPNNAKGMIVRLTIINSNTVVDSTVSLMITEQFIDDNEVVPYIPTNAEIQEFLAVKTYNASCFVPSLQGLVVREQMSLKESGYAWVFDFFVTTIGGVEANAKTKLGTVTPAPPRRLVKHNVTIMKSDNSGVITNDAIIEITKDGSLYITSPVALSTSNTGRTNNGSCVFEAIKL